MTAVEEVAARPFVKWAGGKAHLVDEIRALMPKSVGTKSCRYFEPFVGGGAVFFALQPTHATLGDVNDKLILTYQMIRNDVTGVQRHLHALAKSYNTAAVDGENVYLAERDFFNDDMSPLTMKAARFIFLNKTCFNGLYRVNRKGAFNVPWGKHKTFVPDETNLRACAAALRTVTFASGDFEATMGEAKPGDFIYADPPYIPVSESASFTGYAKSGFGPEDQKRLREAADDARHRGAHVVVSNSDTPLTRAIWKGWKMKSVSRPGTMNSKREKRARVGELLIYR